jgi:hypothetical protein
MADILLRGPDGLDHTIPGVNAVRLRTSGGGTVTFAPAGLLRSLVDRSVVTVTAEDLAGVTEIGDYAFYGCERLTRAELPDTVRAIGFGAFFGCSRLADLAMPDSVTEIRSQAFVLCYALRDPVLGAGVTGIGAQAFNFTSFSSLTCRAVTPPAVAGNTLDVLPEHLPIYVPGGSVNAYRAASGWSSRASDITAMG